MDHVDPYAAFDPWMAPHKIISWQRAVTLLYLGKVEVVEEYDDELRSISAVIKTPAVVRLTKGHASTKQVVRFSRVKLLRKPFKPKTLPITPAFRLEPSRLPSVWQPYCQSIG